MSAQTPVTDKKTEQEIKRARNEMLRNLSGRQATIAIKRIKTLVAQGASKAHLALLQEKPEKNGSKK